MSTLQELIATVSPASHFSLFPDRNREVPVFSCPVCLDIIDFAEVITSVLVMTKLDIFDVNIFT